MPIGMQYRNSNYAKNVFDTYWFERNLQGDIVAIYDDAGIKLAGYTYDAWGNFTVTYYNGGANSAAQYNPFTYRGYYYDSDLGLYYLNSRYYDSNIGRFINADGQLNGDILGCNMFAYCVNNPVMFVDGSGTAPKWWQSILIGVGIIVGTALIVTAITFTGGGAAAFFLAAGNAALCGLKIATVVGVTAGIVRAGKAAVEGGDLEDVGKSFVLGFSDGFLAGSIYAGGSMLLAAGAYRFAGLFNGGYGWSQGSFEGGYQTPNTPGIAFFTHHGGINGGRSFGIDLDIYNGLHFHTNKFGIGKRSKWIKTHHWWLAPVGIGIGVGLSDGWSEW